MATINVGREHMHRLSSLMEGVDMTYDTRETKTCFSSTREGFVDWLRYET